MVQEKMPLFFLVKFKLLHLFPTNINLLASFILKGLKSQLRIWNPTLLRIWDLKLKLKLIFFADFINKLQIGVPNPRANNLDRLNQMMPKRILSAMWSIQHNWLN